MKQYGILLLVAFGSLLPFVGRGQLVVVLEKIPDYTPASDSIFLVGSFNNWRNHDANFCFRPQPDGSYVFRFLTPMPNFEYKINRGDWKTVEGGQYGQAIGNRTYASNNALNDTIRISVLSWEDFPDYIPFWDTLQMRVTGIPVNTPADATLYVAGSFNGWMPGDPNYKMHRDSTGAWLATIPIRTKITDFKISRGSWGNIETLRDGKARPNRRFVYGEDAPDQLLVLEIENWYDLSSYQMTWYAVFLLLTTLQCVLLVVAINSLRDRNKAANRILSALIVVISATFLARLAGLNQANFEQFPKLILLPDIVYFIYGPLFLAYLFALLPAGQRPRAGVYVLHFVPLVVALGVYAPLFLQEPHSFVLAVGNLEYRPLFMWAAVLGWVFNVYYLYRSFRLLRRFAPPLGTISIRRFVHTVFYVHTLCLVFWLAAFIVGGVTHGGDAAAVDALINLIWVTLALGIYTLGYYMMRQPQLFQQPDGMAGQAGPLALPMAKEVRRPEKPEADRPERNAFDDDDEKAQQLEDHMRTAHPYLNPGLSLAELADGIAVPTHQLSRLINDRFDKNFFDYVNAYRIEAFKAQIERGDHETRTILSLALEAGFNSKTAFNRAFKKYTGMTPREYLVQEKKRTEV